MNKPYILIATINGRDLPTKRYATARKAELAMDRMMEDYNLQVADHYDLPGESVYRMEQDLSWFHIRNESRIH